MEEWEGDDTFRIVMPSAKHEPIAYLATAGLDSLIYFGMAMGEFPPVSCSIVAECLFRVRPGRCELSFSTTASRAGTVQQAVVPPERSYQARELRTDAQPPRITPGRRRARDDWA